MSTIRETDFFIGVCMFILRLAIILFSFPYFFGGHLYADVSTGGGIDIVYHIATLNNWEEVVSEQLENLRRTGLGDVCDSLTLTVVGSQITEINKLVEKLSFRHKITIFHAGEDPQLYEFPGIDMVCRIANQKPNSRILYIHSKGVTRYGGPTQKPSELWRRYMEYFVVERWESCLKALEEVDICGVDWTLSESTGFPFFAGNFWWGRANYISRCRLERNNRYDCENFIGTGDNPIVKSFHQSGANPKIMYLYTYNRFPQYFHFPPTSPYFQGIMNLYVFEYLDKYYR